MQIKKYKSPWNIQISLPEEEARDWYQKLFHLFNDIQLLNEKEEVVKGYIGNYPMSHIFKNEDNL